MYVDLPEKLARELNKIDWLKVPETDINLLILFGLPYLKKKGYLKMNEVNNEAKKKQSK